MTPSAVKTHTHWTRPFLLWTGAVIFSLILNLALFGLMPGLSTGVAERPGKMEPLRMLNIVRVKRSEPPPPGKEYKPRPETVATRRKQVVNTQAPIHPVIDRLPRLDFDINPKLPAGPLVLPSPAMETVAFGAPAMDMAFKIDDLDAPLTPLVRIPPIYPIQAKRRGIEGWVKVKFLVNRQGIVEKIKIVDSHPTDIFNRNVVRCVSSWRFKPGTVEGVAVNTWATQVLKFRLAR
ncbi:MAG: hypothetical protein DRH32_06835 [Deltaproteobacteria bacterium]|nr:MAG: hypothetical protein DRH32_06835 [Deltaproteobacteria bacterium]